MTDQLQVSRVEGGIVVVTINRPPANGLTAEFLLEIEAKLKTLEDDDNARAVVITGIEGMLSAGMDLKVMQTLDEARKRQTVDALNQAFYQLYNFSKPLIMAATGHAIAGGFFLVLAADYRIGPEGDAKFGLTEVRVGIPFPVALLEIIRAELPTEAARKMVLQGCVLGVNDIKAWGVLDEIVSAEMVLERAIIVAQKYSENPAKAFTIIKRQLRGPALKRMKDVIEKGDDPVRESWFNAMP